MQLHLQKKCYSFPKKQLISTTANLAPGVLTVSFFKAGCKLVTYESYGISLVFFMWRRLRYLLRVCSTSLKPCSATYVVGKSSSNKWLDFSPNFWKTLAALDPEGCESILKKYDTAFIIAFEVDEKFLKAESHSLILVAVTGKKAFHPVTFFAMQLSALSPQ